MAQKLDIASCAYGSACISRVTLVFHRGDMKALLMAGSVGLVHRALGFYLEATSGR